VSEARESYRNEMDGLADWLAAETIADRVAWTPTTVLYQAYSSWCFRKGITSPLNASHFGRRLAAKAAVTKRDTNKSRGWLGIRLGSDGKRQDSETLSGENSLVETLGNGHVSVPAATEALPDWVTEGAE
jgi:phage/plasmid-associated DNA primase